MNQLLDASAKGVYTIAATPFTDRGDIDWPSVDSLVEFYLQCGVHGLTILGMMGEAQKLSDQESAELVAPLTGLKTETHIVAYFADVVAALGEKTPVVYQDYPQSTQADIAAESFVKMVDAHPSVVMFKHEDCPGLKKLTQMRKACDGTTRRYISILVGNGGLYVPQELARGADGIMTGFAYPEMLVSVCDLFAAGRGEEAEDLFDAYLPLVRHEQQPGFGLAVRKEILRRRGAIRSAAVRSPFGRPGFVHRVRSSMPRIWPRSIGCLPVSRPGSEKVAAAGSPSPRACGSGLGIAGRESWQNTISSFATERWRRRPTSSEP